MMVTGRWREGTYVPQLTTTTGKNKSMNDDWESCKTIPPNHTVLDGKIKSSCQYCGFSIRNKAGLFWKVGVVFCYSQHQSKETKLLGRKEKKPQISAIGKFE
jgi:hypothetical protein